MSTFLINKFINFENFTFSIFAFYFLISLIIWLLSKMYFRNKIEKYNLYNQTLNEKIIGLNNQQKVETNSFYKNSFIVDEKYIPFPSVDSYTVINKIDEPVLEIINNVSTNEEIEQEIVSEFNDQKNFLVNDLILENETIKVSEIVEPNLDFVLEENFEISSELPQIEKNKIVSEDKVAVESIFNEEESKDKIILPKVEIDEISFLESNTEFEVNNEIKEQIADSKIDDLKLIEGIGFKIQEILNSKGIFSFQKLASMNSIEIKNILEEAGSRFSFHDPTSWPQQAELAKDGEWPALRRLQDELDKGKIVK